MANHASSRKRVRRNERRTVINKTRRSRMRTFIKKVEQAIEAGDAKAADLALKEVQPEIARAVAKGIVHKNKGARTMSRLSAGIKNIKKS